MAVQAAGAALAIAGLVTGGFGAWAKANAAKMRQRRLLAAANMPGVDIGAATNESLDNILGTMDKSAAAANQATVADQATLDQLLDAEIPGYRGIQNQRSRITQYALAGELDPSVVGQVNRRAASRALTGGYGGSGMFDALSVRDLGRTVQDEQARGMGYATDLIRSTPLANLTSTASLMGPNPNRVVDLRNADLIRKQALLAEYARTPGGTSVWGDWMSGVGGSLLGAGTAMLGGGMGGMGAMGAMGAGGMGYGGTQMADPGAMAWGGMGFSNPTGFTR